MGERTFGDLERTLATFASALMHLVSNCRPVTVSQRYRTGLTHPYEIICNPHLALRPSSGLAVDTWLPKGKRAPSLVKAGAVTVTVSQGICRPGIGDPPSTSELLQVHALTNSNRIWTRLLEIVAWQVLASTCSPLHGPRTCSRLTGPTLGNGIHGCM
jgi:hypothetical protein